MRVWDWSLDERLVLDIEANGKSYFYRLWKILRVSRRTLNEHLKRLEKQGVIRKDDHFQKGRRRCIRLTPEANLKRSLGILEVRPKARIWRDRKLILLILGMIVRSYVGHVNREGSLIEKNPHKRCLIGHGLSKIPGVSVADVVNQNMHTGLIDEFSYNEVNKAMDKLLRAKIIRTSITPTGDMRYYLDNKYHELVDFISGWSHLLQLLVLRMKRKWFHTNTKPTAEEIDWFVSVVGNKNMKEFFTTLKDKKRHFPKRRYDDYKYTFPSTDETQLEKLIQQANITDIRTIKDTKLWVMGQIKELVGGILKSELDIQCSMNCLSKQLTHHL